MSEAPYRPPNPSWTFRVPRALRAGVEAKAAEQGDDVNDVVILALESYLASQPARR